MKRTLFITWLTVALCAAVVRQAGAYENPRYITSAERPDGTIDTIAVLTCQTDPQYLQPTQLQIEYYVNRDYRDSVRLYIATGEVCKFYWDKYSHTWYGDFEPGDTLKSSFEFTPLQVGTIGVGFSVAFGGRAVVFMPFGFTLDEQGRVVPGVLSEGRYGMLGPAPQAMGETVFLDKGCLYINNLISSQGFGLGATLSPPFAYGEWSQMTYTIMPSIDLQYGIYYRLEHSDLFEVELVDSADWMQFVVAGDSLPVSIRIRPVESGIGILNLYVWGYTPEKHPTHRLGTDTGGKITARMQVTFAIDEGLNLVGYSLHGLPPANASLEDLNDAYRLSIIRALPVIETNRIINSVNFMTRKRELDSLFRND